MCVCVCVCCKIVKYSVWGPSLDENVPGVRLYSVDIVRVCLSVKAAPLVRSVLVIWHQTQQDKSNCFVSNCKDTSLIQATSSSLLWRQVSYFNFLTVGDSLKATVLFYEMKTEDNWDTRPVTSSVCFFLSVPCVLYYSRFLKTVLFETMSDYEMAAKWGTELQTPLIQLIFTRHCQTHLFCSSIVTHETISSTPALNYRQDFHLLVSDLLIIYCPITGSKCNLHLPSK